MIKMGIARTVTPEQRLEDVLAGQKNYKENIEIIESVLKKERGYIFKIPYNEDVIVPLSGGLDSTGMIGIIIEEWNVTVHPVYFKRGARNEIYEEKAFDFFVKYYSKKYPGNMEKPVKANCEIPPKDIKEKMPQEVTLSVGHPMRNATMQNFAAMYATAIGNELDIDINTILVGSVAEDTTSPESGLLSLRSQMLNICINTGVWDWQLTSPLIEPGVRKTPLDKVDLIDYFLKNDMPLEKTRTCIGNSEVADGECGACKTRLNAFKYLKIKDPLEYKKRDDSI